MREDVPTAYSLGGPGLADSLARLFLYFADCHNLEWDNRSDDGVTMAFLGVQISRPDFGWTNSSGDLYVFEWITDSALLKRALANAGRSTFLGDFGNSSMEVDQDECRLAVTVEGRLWYSLTCGPSIAGTTTLTAAYNTGHHVLQDARAYGAYWQTETEPDGAETVPRQGAFTAIGGGSLTRYPGIQPSSLSFQMRPSNDGIFVQLDEIG